MKDLKPIHKPTEKELNEWIRLANRHAKSNTIYTTSFQRNAMRALARIAFRAGLESKESGHD